MALIRFLRLFRAATRYVSPDVDASDEDAPSIIRQASYHRRIVAVAIACTIGAAILGSIGALLEGPSEGRSESVVMYLSMPLVFGAMGMFFGVSASCLFAPREFLAGPAGRKWLRLIGTDKIGVARGVCLVLTIIGCVLFGLLSLSFFK